MRWSNIKYLILRRFVQIGLLFLYAMGNYYGWKVLQGNLSSSKLFDAIPLSDPFATLQIISTGVMVGINVVVGALIISLFYGLIGGRAFCSWVCPVNMITDLAAWLRKKLLIDKIERKVWISRNIRYYMIVLAFIGSWPLVVWPLLKLLAQFTIFNRNVDMLAVYGGMGIPGLMGGQLGYWEVRGFFKGWANCP